MMGLSLESQCEAPQQKSRNEIIKILNDEIVFLGRCYGKAKNIYQQRIIRNAGSKLQEILHKQKMQESLKLHNKEFQNIVNQVYCIITDVVSKM